ncbi:hypothetical protein V6N12_075820 [Hibiscus sabdariffa]|uniref:RNase H type-1 domain-containing protein n=1 Tax=Hibiscus sabdariffa TaxID=183260 RepID=A0ABR2CAN5_9ROSI
MTAEISQKLSGIMENFLGGASAMRKKIHWVNWTSLCFSLSSGGLGSDTVALMPNNSKLNACSWMWKGVVNSFYKNDDLSSCLRSNLHVKVGMENIHANSIIADIGFVLKEPKANSMSWISPPPEFMKLNANGTMKVDGSVGGIRGTIQTLRCETLIFFSESIGSCPPILAKLLTIKFGITLFRSLKSCDKSRLVVEYDCKSALEWISKPSSCAHSFPVCCPKYCEG